MNKGEVRKTAVVGGKVNPIQTIAPPAASAAVKAVAHPIQSAIDPQIMANLKRELEEVKEQVVESDNVIISLEKERDFYFSKLRQIEVICQDNEQIGTVDVARVFAILYETEEGFAPPDENEMKNGDEVY
ncbi:unnamed protein product [Onchocerca flexuosa]|uniref:EB1 C-terminal domain-containing protein n=1 Tax=Onchocerca flexuosa TaxID=387005 RepID=A0A183I6I0_9BILA|nr:unnamed protein product [Onchocerca flexuosa]